MPRPTILFIDDEENVRHAMRRSLRHCEYELLFADGPELALELLRTMSVDIIVSDNVMPGMTGRELLSLCRDCCPDAVRIMLTGGADMSTAIAAINRGEIYQVLAKPWDDLELQVTLNLAWEKLQLERENRRLLATLHARDPIIARIEREQPGIARQLREEGATAPSAPPSTVS